MDIEIAKSEVRSVLDTQHFGVFSTVHRDQPHSVLVCFCLSEDFQEIVFFTPRGTRKLVNSKIFGKVGLFVDTTVNSANDIHDAKTVKIHGIANHQSNIDEERINILKKEYLRKNEFMKDFISSPSIEMVIISIERIEIVSNFQTVVNLVRTDLQIMKIEIRQLQGFSLNKGYGRGKAYHIQSELITEDIPDNCILIIDKITLEHLPDTNKIKGIIIREDIQEYISKIDLKKVPVITSIDYNLDLIKDGEQLSIDGYLGIVIFHNIR